MIWDVHVCLAVRNCEGEKTDRTADPCNSNCITSVAVIVFSAIAAVAFCFFKVKLMKNKTLFFLAQTFGFKVDHRG